MSRSGVISMLMKAHAKAVKNPAPEKMETDTNPLDNAIRAGSAMIQS